MRILIFLSGDPPCIDKGPDIPQPCIITKGNKRVKIGSPVYILDGYNVTIDCNASGTCTPPITITWVLFRNGISIPMDEYDNVNTITIPNVKDEDVVTCRANSIEFDEVFSTIIIPKGNYSKTIFAVYKATINIILVSHP